MIVSAEQGLAGSEKHREHQQVAAVDEIGVGEPACEFCAAMDEDGTTIPVLQFSDVVA